MFFWYLAHGDGTATRYESTPEIDARVDRSRETGERWFGNPEGAILHGGVIATAYKRKVEQTFDADQWLRTGKRVFAGFVTMTEITAESRA